MGQIAIGPFVNVRAMIELLIKVIPDRKFVVRYMIDNVRIRTRRKSSNEIT